MPQTFAFRRKSSEAHHRPDEAANYIQACLKHPDAPDTIQDILRACVLTCAAASSPYDPKAAPRQNREDASENERGDRGGDRSAQHNGGPTAKELAQQKERKGDGEDGAPPPEENNRSDGNEKTRSDGQTGDAPKREPFYKKYTR